MLDINKYLRDIRKRRGYTLREAADRSGLSHSYISSLENGVHPKTKAPIKPSPDTLNRLSEAYNEDYEELMFIAGYSKENSKGNANAIPDSEFDIFIKEMELKYNVSLKDDPIVRASWRQLVESIAQTKLSQQKPRNRG